MANIKKITCRDCGEELTKNYVSYLYTYEAAKIINDHFTVFHNKRVKVEVKKK